MVRPVALQLGKLLHQSATHCGECKGKAATLERQSCNTRKAKLQHLTGKTATHERQSCNI